MGFQSFRHALIAASVAALATGFLMMSGPVANADHIESGISDAPGGPGIGHLSISTQPGKFIAVDIVGRFDALGAVVEGPPNACDVYLGALDEQHVTLDALGAAAHGSARSSTTATSYLAPAERTYHVVPIWQRTST